MAVYNKMQQKQIFMGKLDFSSDLLDELTALCCKEDITLGKITAIGAVQKARVGYYDQKNREYQFVEINKNLEIISLVGNISIRDGKPMVHAHIALSDRDGNAFGGHLAKGTIVFACEFTITAYNGAEHIREPDEQTGLPLWRI